MIPQLVLIGIAGGLFSALFGVGGGIIIVPLLLFTGKFSERPAMATSLAAIGVTALAGTISYAAEGRVHVAAAALVGVPAAAGAFLGATWQQRIPTRRLSYAFAALLVAIAIELLLKPVKHHPAAEVGRVHLTPAKIVLALAVGFAAGVVAGMFGVGGGILFVPVLTIVVGLGQLAAEATSLLAVLPTVGAGVWRQRRYGNVRWQAAAIIGVASVAGVQGGVHIATRLPEDVLRKLFAVLIILIAAQTVRRAWRHGPPVIA